jgi:CDP-glucose 4,6-dehydratase
VGERRRALEDLVMFGGVYGGRRVFVTGHTGFKGTWLTLWLLGLGADVTGYALEPPTEPSMFDAVGLGSAEAVRSGGGRLTDLRGDVRDRESLAAAMGQAAPDIVLHLAAQPLVRRSYAEPHLTFATNVMGTVNLFEAVRAQTDAGRGPRAVLNVTSDKCYENRETAHAYREDDAMGGDDPYSASKGCAELVTASYRHGFFDRAGLPLIASARAGNVIGGGDWGEDRIVPDCARALSAGRRIEVRNPGAVRPWQHVLESLSGYLWLAARMWVAGPATSEDERRAAPAGAWNFGPHAGSQVPVSAVVDLFVRAWGGGEWRPAPEAAQQPHEAGLLTLDPAKAEKELGWRAVWGVEEAVQAAAAWYLDFASGADAASLLARSRADIAAYSADAAAMAAPWTAPEPPE